MRSRSLLAILVLVLVAPAGWTLEAAPEGEAESDLQRIDGLLEKGTDENDRASGLDLMKASLDLCLKCMEERPDDYEVLWRCARSAHQYAETARNQQAAGWKETCKEWGRQGMEIAGRAQGIEPERVEGYFWQAACIGVYSDGTGVMTAVKEGFYKKSKNAMAKAYELDKSYNDYDPVFGSAMFWIALPFPLKSKKKALEYYREFEQSTTWTVRPYLRRLYGADLLMQVKPKGYKEEAKALLDHALQAPHLQKYYKDWAEELQARLK
jgi:hypothetical protein